MALGYSLPPGFRFFPTDEELVAYYLKRRALFGINEGSIIGDLDIYKFEPMELPNLAVHRSRDGQWYFFAPNTKKNANSARSGRSTALGYWKATGKDREVYSRSVRMGMKKTLVYYQGRAPNGKRTDWIMHEYRLDEEYERKRKVQNGFVVCKVFKKGGRGPRNGEQYGPPVEDIDDETSSALHFTENSCLSGFEVDSVEEKAEFSSALSTQSVIVKQEDMNQNPILYSNPALFKREQTAGTSDINTLPQSYLGLYPIDSNGLKSDSTAFAEPNLNEVLALCPKGFDNSNATVEANTLDKPNTLEDPNIADEAIILEDILEQIMQSVDAVPVNPSQKTADDSNKFSVDEYLKYPELGILFDLGPGSIYPLDAEVKVLIVGGLMHFVPRDFQASGGREHDIVNGFDNTCVTSSFAEKTLQMHCRMNQARYVEEAELLFNTQGQLRHFPGAILARYGFFVLPCLMVLCNAITVYLENSKGPCCLNSLLMQFVCNIAIGDYDCTLFGTQYDVLIVQVLDHQQWRISSPHLTRVASPSVFASIVWLASGSILCSLALTTFVQSFYGHCLKLYSYILGLAFDEHGLVVLVLLKQLILSTAHMQNYSGEFCNADLMYDSCFIISSFSDKNCID